MSKSLTSFVAPYSKFTEKWVVGFWSRFIKNVSTSNSSQNIPYFPQKVLKLFYKGEPLEQVYKPDFICFDKIIIELKAAKAIAPEHRAQLFNYLKATGFKLGLLVNFGSHPMTQIDRIVV